MTIAAMLADRAGDDHAGLLFEDEAFSWAEIVAAAAVRAEAALELRRDGPFHIGLMLDNVPEYLFWLGGAALAGATVVGINPTRRGEYLAADIRHTDCQLIVTDSEHMPLLDRLEVGVGRDRVLVVDSSDRDSAGGHGTTGGGTGRGTAAGEGTTGGGRGTALSYTDLLAARSGAALPDVDVQPSDPLLLIFTSGSTGSPKAVVCSQGRLARIGKKTPAMYGICRDTVTYNAMPLFHGNALMANWAGVLGAGATFAMRRRFSASAFLPDIRGFGASFFNYVGRALAYILATPELPDDADHPLALAFGTEASERDRAEFARRFGCRVVEGYGASEGAIAIGRSAGAPAGALGKPLNGEDVIVAEPATGTECPPARFGPEGQLLNGDQAIGEMVGRNVVDRFEGYYNNVEAVSERVRDGWYWTGDLAYRDEDGWIYFAGRSTDLLRVDSENFSAAPVEAILNRLPDVVMVAVYAVPDPRTGDQVMAALEMTPGQTFDPLAFGAWLEEQRDLGTKWAPRFVRIVADMPLTATNKVQKLPLRNDTWHTTDPVYWRRGRELAYEVLSEADRAELDRALSEHRGAAVG